MRNQKSRSQAGDTWVNTLIWGTITAIIIFVSYRSIKPQYNMYYMESKVDELTRRGAMNYMTEETAVKEVLELAKKEHIPLAKEDIQVTKSGATLTIKVTIVQEIDLWLVKWQKKNVIEKSSSNW